MTTNPTKTVLTNTENLLDQVLANTVSKTAKPTKRRRLLWRDKEARLFMTNWYKYLRKEWLPFIHEMGFTPGSDLERTGLLMMMGFATQDSRHIANITGWDLKWIMKRRYRALQHNIWLGNGYLNATWFDLANETGNSADIAFICDVMVINGDMNKYRNGAYNLTPQGLAAVEAPNNQDPLQTDLDRFTDDGNRNE